MRKGNLLITLGLLLMAGAAGLSGFNLWQSERAGQAAARDLEILVDTREAPPATLPELPALSVPVEEYLAVPEMEMPVVEVNGREYVGTLELPAIGRTLPVLNGWDAELLQVAPCRYEGSAYTGNLIIMAHNYDSHFGKLKNLRSGDAVIFRDMEGNTFSYEVVSMETLNPEDTQKMEEGDWDLTLFTCTVGGKTRVTVRCALAETAMSTEYRQHRTMGAEGFGGPFAPSVQF